MEKILTAIFAAILGVIAALLYCLGARIDQIFMVVAFLAIPFSFVMLEEITSKYKRKRRKTRRSARRASERRAA